MGLSIRVRRRYGLAGVAHVGSSLSRMFDEVGLGWMSSEERSGGVVDDEEALRNEGDVGLMKSRLGMMGEEDTDLARKDIDGGTREMSCSNWREQSTLDLPRRGMLSSLPIGRMDTTMSGSTCLLIVPEHVS